MHITAQHPHTSPFQAVPTSPSAFSKAGMSSSRSASAAASGATPADAGSSDDSTSTATITANDFLQLLVTELQNQDPTADTDPNEYVDQLVQVNSLQQLIQINQNTEGSSSTASSGGSSSSDPTTVGSSGVGSGSAHRAPTGNGLDGQVMAGQTSPTTGAQGSRSAHLAPHGNLSPNEVHPPSFSAAAGQIAGSLATGKSAHRPPGSAPIHAIPLQ